jgi:cytoskeletal protein RodZ
MEVGRQLSEARQRQHLTIADISRTTKIPVHLLEAIERNDVDHLPQGFFTRAFVRAYAKEVGVDADSLVDSIEESEVERVPMDLPTAHVPIEEHTSSRSFVAVIALCAACTAYSGFQWRTAEPLTPQIAVASAPAPLRAAAVNAVAPPPCVAVPPPASTIQATSRTSPPAPIDNVAIDNVATVGTVAAPAIHVTAVDRSDGRTPAADSAATTSEPATVPADRNPAPLPAEQF